MAQFAVEKHALVTECKLSALQLGPGRSRTALPGSLHSCMEQDAGHALMARIRKGICVYVVSHCWYLLSLLRLHVLQTETARDSKHTA